MSEPRLWKLAPMTQWLTHLEIDRFHSLIHVFILTSHGVKLLKHCHSTISRWVSDYEYESESTRQSWYTHNRNECTPPTANQVQPGGHNPNQQRQPPTQIQCIRFEGAISDLCGHIYDLVGIHSTDLFTTTT